MEISTNTLQLVPTLSGNQAGQLRLYNTSNSLLGFQVLTNLAEALKAYPYHGFLAANESQIVNFSFEPQRLKSADVHVKCAVAWRPKEASEQLSGLLGEFTSAWRKSPVFVKVAAVKLSFAMKENRTSTLVTPHDLALCKRLIRKGDYSAAKSQFDKFDFEQITDSMTASQAQCFKEYLRCSICVESVLRQTDSVISRCNVFLNKFPHTVEILVTRGLACMKENRRGEAAQNFQEALDIDTNNGSKATTRLNRLLTQATQPMKAPANVSHLDMTLNFPTEEGEASPVQAADPGFKLKPDHQTQSQSTFNVLLVGETGSGKSTLLNMLVNYFRGSQQARSQLPTKQQLKIAVPTAYLAATEPEGAQHSERNTTDRSQSKSTKAVGYDFQYQSEDGSQYMFYIVDTPGLNDTEGADDANLDNILEKAASLSHISAVMLVANGSQVRETIGMKNVFTLLRGHLPDAVLTNTLAVLTNCTKLSRNLNIQSLPVRVKPEHVFYLQNSAFSSDPNRWATAAAHEQAELHTEWAAAMKAINRMVTTILQLAAASSTAFRSMHELRQRLRSQVTGCLADLRAMQQLQDELESCQGPDGNTAVLPTISLTGLALLDRVNDLDAVQQAQAQKMQQIKSLCRALQQICSRFSLTDEMSVLLKGMQIQARQLDTVSARIAADNCIQDLSKFIVALAEEVPQSSFTDPVYDYDSNEASEDSSSQESDDDDDRDDKSDAEEMYSNSWAAAYAGANTDQSSDCPELLETTSELQPTQSAPTQQIAADASPTAGAALAAAQPDVVMGNVSAAALPTSTYDMMAGYMPKSVRKYADLLSSHLSRKMSVSPSAMGSQEAAAYAQVSLIAAKHGIGTPEAHVQGLRDKLQQTQVELAQTREYRAAAEHRQRLAAAAASMAAFTQARLEAQAASLEQQVKQAELAVGK